MATAAWRILAFSALLGTGAVSAHAEVVIGGTSRPSVEVNWSVLDRLGREPTLADMLKADIPSITLRAPADRKEAGVAFRPYTPDAKKAVRKKVSKAATPKKPKVTPAVAKVERAPAVAELVQAVHKPAQPAKVEPAKVEKAVAGPVVSLPEVPKPAAAPQPAPAKPVQIASVDPQVAGAAEPEAAAKVEPQAATKVEPQAAVKVEPQAAVKVEPSPEPAKPVQIAEVEPPAPTPSPVVKAEAPPQVAALPVPSNSVIARGDTLSLLFASDAAIVADDARAALQRVAKRMEKEEGLGLQLLAYAEGDAASASKARRLSLSRALEVRKFLMEHGVRSTRIEVRALGNKIENGPADRVDAVLVSR